MTDRQNQDWKYASKAMAWYGWGSPIGLGAFVVCAGVVAVLVRVALLGW
jgi:hypothetical protein